MTITNSVRMIVTSTAKTLDIPLPATLNQKFTEAAELWGKARSVASERTGPTLVATVVEELRKGADPLDSPEVQRLALAQQLSNAGVAHAVSNITDSMIATALVDSADEILSAWSKDLAPHAAKLMEAATALSSDDLHDLAGIQRAPVAYSHAVDALRRFDAAKQGAQQLASLARVSVNDATVLWLDDQSRLLELKRAAASRSEPRPSPWIAARLGITPRFVASLGEIMERLAANREQRIEMARPTERKHNDPKTNAVSA